MRSPPSAKWKLVGAAAVASSAGMLLLFFLLRGSPPTALPTTALPGGGEKADAVKRANAADRFPLPTHRGARPGHPAETNGGPVADDPRSRIFPDGPVGDKLEIHLDVAFDVGASADQNYQASLESLRTVGDEAAKMIDDAYRSGALPQPIRYLLVETLGALDSAVAIAPLMAIATSELPDLGTGLTRSRNMEVPIRMSALRGIAHLARRGDKIADDGLLRLATTVGNITLQREAIRNFIAAGSDRTRREAALRQALPVDKHEMLRLDATPLEESVRLASGGSEASQ
jgi:hypothetical protein